VDHATLSIRLLGGFSVELDGAVLSERAWRLRKARSLVKVVALAPGRHVHRDVLAELLWPERDAAAATNNLHQALHAARRALGDPAALTLADDVLALTPDAWVDVDAFEHAVAVGDVDGALELYRGELLPEDRFAEWTDGRRAALREVQLDLCLRRAERASARGDPGAAIAVLTSAAVDAPRHEPVRRALMRALAGAGRRQDALAQFEQLRDALRAHNEADPDPETRALYRDLLGERSVPSAPAVPARHGLPTLLTSFVGRERELAELQRLLDRTRLLTLTGPGGAGKTRLALQAAAARAGALAGGAWLADLGALRDPVLVAQAVATALGVPIPANRPAIDALIAHLGGHGGRDVLIVLDTCEHVLEACAHLAEALLAAAPGVRLLATSREPLRCAAEVAWRVPSLAEAPVLFAERAAGVGAVALDADLVQQICWRLDRMPLAVELAAARTGALTLEQIAARLGDSLDVLSAGTRTALTRQQTLRATIAWSHDLLTGEERVLFRRLAVFAGGCSLEAAEAVCADGTIARRRVADLVGRLVDKSLLNAEDGRFRYVDTIRQFADEQLAGAGEHDAVAGRHLDWCLALAHDHDPTFSTGGRSLRMLEVEHDNLRAALTFALDRDPQAALALATRLWRFWLDRSWFVEGTRWMDAVLDAAPERTALRVEALLAASALALRRGDPDVYLRRIDETLGIYDDLGDAAASAEAHLQHAMFEAYVNASDRSAQRFTTTIAIAERLGHPHIAAGAAHASALAPWQRSDTAGAIARLQDAIGRLRALPPGPIRFLEAVTLGMLPLGDGPDGALRLVWESTMFAFRRLDREQSLGLALNNLAWAQRARAAVDGEPPPPTVDAALEEALRRFRGAGDPSGEALTLAHMGHVARSAGDPSRAREHLEAALALRRELGEQRDAGVTLLGLGLAHGAAGQPDAARTAFAAALHRFEATDDLPAMAGARTNWAIVEERLGELDRARELYTAGAAVWGAQRIPRAEAWARVGLADVLERLGERDAAAAVREQVRAACTAVGDRLGVAAVAAQHPLSGRKDAPA
jgi:predicted ATPase/DNA-binding SARP family transcriptional activator